MAGGLGSAISMYCIHCKVILLGQPEAVHVLLINPQGDVLLTHLSCRLSILSSSYVGVTLGHSKRLGNPVTAGVIGSEHEIVAFGGQMSDGKRGHGVVVATVVVMPRMEMVTVVSSQQFVGLVSHKRYLN